MITEQLGPELLVHARADSIVVASPATMNGGDEQQPGELGQTLIARFGNDVPVTPG